jgi:hypothetical protein
MDKKGAMFHEVYNFIQMENMVLHLIIITYPEIVSGQTSLNSKYREKQKSSVRP